MEEGSIRLNYKYEESGLHINQEIFSGDHTAEYR